MNDFLQKLKNTLTTAAQQNKSARRKRYKILIPCEEIKKVIIDNKTMNSLDAFLVSKFFLKVFFPSTIIKLDIAFNMVSILLTVKDIARKTIITTIKIFCLLSIREKKARSGYTFEFNDTDIKPENPIKKTILIVNRKDIIKPVFSTLKFFAA